MKAINDAGYTTPTPIQAEAIPHVMAGGDVTGIAQTGTGKTAAFVLPMLHRLAKGRARARMPRTLILAPTRELAAQVSENFETYGKHLKFTMALLIGGVSFKEQETLLMRGVDVLIATPGRLIDQFERGKILLNGVEILVIDEADRMLDMGFVPDIEKICKLLPPRRQTLLFSATMPPEIARLAKTFQQDPKRIEVTRPTQTAETITQYVVKISRNDDKAKRTALRCILKATNVQNGIVFCNRKVEVDIVAKSLLAHGFDAAAIHGDLPQSYRTQTLDKFRNGELKLLIASDVAARGLDIPEVSHVFNYSPPPKDEDYIHRIGRTGRAGRTGESYTIVSPSDVKNWEGVLKMIRQDVKDYMPDGLAEEIDGLPADEGRRSSRGGRDEKRTSSRGPRGRDAGGRGRAPREETKPAAAPVALEVIEPAEVLDLPVPPKPEKSARPERAPRSAKPRETSPAPAPAPSRSEAPRRERDRDRPKRDHRRPDDDPILAPAMDGVRGCGDDVPAFLRR